MKKTLLILSFALCAAFSNASVQYSMYAGQFYSNTGSTLTSGTVVFVLDTSGGNFDDFILSAGDSLTAGSYLNASSDYYVLSTGSIGLVGDGYYSAFCDYSVSALPDSSYSGKNIGLLFIDSDGLITSIDAGDYYGLYTPEIGQTDYSLTIDQSLNDGDNWIMNADGIYYLYGYSAGADGYIPNAAFQTSTQVVPEPAAFAAVFGLCALGIAAYKRRGRK